ncbi:MAG: tetratricopeptide repeat protein [Cellvibrionaceae bacterium]
MNPRCLKWNLLTLVSVATLAGCAGQKPNTLGSLRYQPEPEPPAQVASASHQEVRTEYAELLDLIDDQNLKEQIERRIAHVYMLEGEQEKVETTPGKSYYVEAIKSYREVLEKYPNSPDNAEILYQLAKAYDMEGDQDEALAMLLELTARHPYYENIAEANFRKGDILFNRNAYREAENAYRSVTTHSDSKFYLNAHYMLGWSQYKQLRFQQALGDFVHVLNQLLEPVTALEDLSKPNQSLVNDTLHAVSLTLDKLAGAASIETLPQLKDQYFVWMVYDNLGQYYLEKELYEASAESYRLFVQHHGDEELTPILHRKMIETYMAGSFPGQAFQEKERFVDAYGIYSGYAKRRGGTIEPIRDSMQEYLDELARNYHARGQELQAEIDTLQEDDQRPPEEEKITELDEEAIVSLDKAAFFYQQFIDTFPNYEKLDGMVFSRAEALFAARHYDQSIVDYERVAYQPQTTNALADDSESQGADAGYAAIIAYERHIDGLPEESSTTNRWRADAVASMLRFAEKYHQDQRSASVLTNAAEYIFSLDQYERALQIATDLIDNNPDLDRTLKKTAYGILAHSLFKLERFAEAGEGYLLQRQLVSDNSEEHHQITERLASAIYKHSETIIAEDDKLAAVEELLKLKQLTPDSPVRITAQYDAATLLIELQVWPRAIAELSELKQAYPDHELATEFPRKLAFAYEKNSNWQLAAEEYVNLSTADPDPELRREALYLAGSMYENNENYNAAIEQFRDYANQYAEPFATLMEARYRLTQNHERVNDTEKRMFWLQKLVDGNNEAGQQQNERSRWLAAWANAEYGDHHAAQFNNQAVSLPLDESLPIKNDLLEKATARYQLAADSGDFEFVTMSAYKIAELYQSLATELRQSPRPANLSADERALYSEILDEQALPFDELAMDLHQGNLERAWEGEFNIWINQSFDMMRRLYPARYAKAEMTVSYGDEIR